MSEILFDEAVRSEGGRLDPSSLAPTTADYIAFMRKGGEKWIESARLSHPNLPPIHFDFVATEEINAKAFLYKGQRFIGVTFGAMLAIGLLFERMMSDCRIRTDIGDPKQGLTHPPLNEPLLDTLLKDHRANGQLPRFDSAREEFCTALCQLAFNFLFFHELTHIMNGHVDYYANRNRSPFLAEFGWTPTSVKESIELQLLELDADAGAAARITDLVNQWSKTPPSQNPYLQTYNSIFVNSIFAMFSFFRIFQDQPLKGMDLYKSSHPPFRARLGSAIEIVKGCVESRHSIPFASMAPYVREALYETELAFHHLVGSEITDDRYIESFDAIGQQYRQTMMKRWNEGFRQEIKAHSYAEPMVDTSMP